MSKPLILETVEALRATTRAWRRAGETISLVPTMGALHAGHISLADTVRARTDRVIVTIFVNPTQFAPTEDFSKYPRTFEADIAKVAAAGVDAVYAPNAAVMYPPGFATTVSLDGPAAAGLEDRFRPTHFAGVATVVAKLQMQAMPNIAIYGEKDFQQLAVIRRMTRDLDMPIEIFGGTTVREADGLALSSRNVYLKPEERAVAPTLHRSMTAAAGAIRRGAPVEACLAESRAAITGAGFALDYLDLRDAETLGPADVASGRPLRLLVAAKIGATRLIDNIAV